MHVPSFSPYTRALRLTSKRDIWERRWTRSATMILPRSISASPDRPADLFPRRASRRTGCESIRDAIGVKNSSAQITKYYDPRDLVGKLVLGVVNFRPVRSRRFFGSADARRDSWEGDICLITRSRRAVGRSDSLSRPPEPLLDVLVEKAQEISHDRMPFSVSLSAPSTYTARAAPRRAGNEMPMSACFDSPARSPRTHHRDTQLLRAGIARLPGGR